MQNQAKSPVNGENKNEERNITAIQQLAETFGSLDEMLELFEDLQERIMWAYTGREQPNHFLTGDYDFIRQLKRAMKTDLKNAQPAPNYGLSPVDHSKVHPLTYQKITNVEQVIKIAEAKGITDFKAVNIEGEQVLVTNWTKPEAKAYQTSNNEISGYFSDEGVFIIRFLHLIQGNKETF